MTPRTLNMAGALIAVAALIILPLVFRSSYILGVATVALCYAIWAASWDFMSGLTGRENFGHALFIGVGAYAFGFANVAFELPPWVGLLVGPIIAVVFSLAVGIPTLRLSGPYFALAMLSSSVVMQKLAIIFSSVTGGQDGLNGISPIFNSQRTSYYFTLAFLVVTVGILKYLALSPMGTLLRAIRGDEATCQAAGINVNLYKIVALMISAAFAGLGGALYANYQLQVGPDLFEVALAINIIVMVYVGGMGSIWGAAGGAMLLIGLTESLRAFSEYRLWVYTFLLIMILFFIPKGIVAPVWKRIRDTLSRGPARRSVPETVS